MGEDIADPTNHDSPPELPAPLAVMNRQEIAPMITQDEILSKDYTESLPSLIELENNLGYMKKKGRPSAPRIHTSKKKDGHENQYSELLLYTSWRSEEHFHAENAELCIQKFIEQQEEIKENNTEIIK